jgi:drug/metabolite transporter (DMT)-like permease
MKRTLAYVGLALAIVFWGGSFIATKVSLRELSPAAITAVRFGIGLVVLLAASAARRDLPLPRRADLPILILLGFLGTAFHQFLQATALETVSATVASWIVATIPVFVALLGWTVLGERLGLRRVGGILVAAVGVLLVVSGGDVSTLVRGEVGTIGDLLSAASAVNWAVFTVLSKRVLARSDGSGLRPLPMMVYVMAFGWGFSLAWVAVAGGWQAVPRLSLTGWWAVGFLGVACSALAYLFWYDALNLIDATQAGVFLYFEPLVTAVLAWPILGERMGVPAVLGAAAILAGVWVVERQAPGRS